MSQRISITHTHTSHHTAHHSSAHHHASPPSSHRPSQHVGGAAQTRDTARLSSEAREATHTARDGHAHAAQEHSARAHAPAGNAATQAHHDGSTPNADRLPRIDAAGGPLRQGAGLIHADDRVNALQSRLSRAGMQVGATDGRFGPQTRRAVEDFQRKNGLPVSGIADEKTISALNRIGGTSTPPGGGSATTPSRSAAAGAGATPISESQRGGGRIPDFGNRPTPPQLSQQLEAASRKYGIPANLLKAVAYKESTYGQRVYGADGHGRGVMQIDNRWHAFARGPKAMNAAANIDYSARELLKWKERGGSWERALGHYNGGTRPNMKYAHKVMEFMRTQPWRALGG